MKNSSLLLQFRGLALLVFSLFFLASCGGGGGDSNTTTAANTEVINGIAVPPEPDPEKNNATVAGIDKNNNGVRDDVERKIAEQTPDVSRETIAVAKAYEKIVSSNGKSKEEIVGLFKAVECNDISLSRIDIYSLYVNSEDRYQAYLEAYTSLSGGMGDMDKFCGK